MREYTKAEIIDSYERNVDMVYRVCFAYMKNKQDAEDAVQTTFKKFIRNSKKYKEIEYEKAWLLVTSSNTCKDMLRQKWRKHLRLSENTVVYEVDSDLDDLCMQIIDLPDKYKLVIYLYYYEGYKTEEISRMLKKPSSTIRNYLTEARRYLKQLLEVQI